MKAFIDSEIPEEEIDGDKITNLIDRK